MRISQGWHFKTRLLLVVLVAFATVISITSQAATLSVRDVSVTGKNQVTVQFDGPIPKGSLNLDFVRDNVQFSFLNTTIYPAKMMHAENSVFNKIFAYQYSPNLVRIRFTVNNGQAEQFRGKMRWSNNGKTLSIVFPDSVAVAEKNTENKAAVETKMNLDEQKEKTLLSKVIASEEAADKTTEKAPEEAPVQKVEKKKSSVTSQPLTLQKSTQLGGAKPTPSLARSFFAMFIIVGGLGAVLFYVKRKKNSLQAKVIGKTWWSNLLPSSMRKPKSFIEVVGTHALGPKQSIVVVKIRGQQFVLGVTQDNVQLITQLDSDEAEVDLLGDPAVSESIGMMFGARPTPAQVTRTTPASFNAILNSSTGAGAIVGRNTYQAQATQELPVRTAAQPVVVVRAEPSVRDQIRRRLENRPFEGTRNT